MSLGGGRGAAGGGLCLCLGRAFRGREEPAGDLHLAAVEPGRRFSDVGAVADRAAGARTRQGGGGAPLIAPEAKERDDDREQGKRPLRRTGQGRQGPYLDGTDRKSTRLNSSH